MNIYLNKLQKSTIFFSILFLSFSIFFSVSAQEILQIHVQDLVLDNTTYKSGSVINGTFSLYNPNELSVSDTYYRVSLDGGYEGGVAFFTYTYNLSGPIYLLPSEKKDISFQFQLPQSVSDPKNIGIKVRAITKNGLPLSFQDRMIFITDSKGFFDIEQASIKAGNDIFNVSTGPIIHSDEKASIEFKLKNLSSNTLSGTPNIVIYNMDSAGKLLKTFTSDKISISSKKDKIINIILPQDLGAGVFYGEMNILDSNGNKISQMIPFRYVISGNIATIQSVRSNKSQLSKNESFNINVFFTGLPEDIRQISTSTTIDQKYDMLLKVINENNEIVSSTTKLVNFSNPNIVTFNLKSAYTSKSLSAEVIVSKDGKVINTYSTLISRIEDYKPITSSSLNFSENILTIIIILLLILSIVCLYFALKIDNDILNSIFILLLILLIVSVGLKFYQTVDGAGVSENVTLDTAVNNIQIFTNYPENQIPGGKFSVSGSVNFTTGSAGRQCFSGLFLNNGQPIAPADFVTELGPYGAFVINKGGSTTTDWVPLFSIATSSKYSTVFGSPYIDNGGWLPVLDYQAGYYTGGDKSLTGISTSSLGVIGLFGRLYQMDSGTYQFYSLYHNPVKQISKCFSGTTDTYTAFFDFNTPGFTAPSTLGKYYVDAYYLYNDDVGFKKDNVTYNNLFANNNYYCDRRHPLSGCVWGIPSETCLTVDSNTLLYPYFVYGCYLTYTIGSTYESTWENLDWGQSNGLYYPKNFNWHGGISEYLVKVSVPYNVVSVGSCGLSTSIYNIIPTYIYNPDNQTGFSDVFVKIKNNSGKNFGGSNNATLTVIAPIGRAQTLLPETPFDNSFYWNFDNSLSCVNATGSSPWISPITPYYSCVRYSDSILQNLINSKDVYIAPQNPLYGSSTSPYILPVVDFDNFVVSNNIKYQTKNITIPLLVYGASTTVEIKMGIYTNHYSMFLFSSLNKIQFKLDCGLSASCTVNLPSASTNQPVTWTATSTGAAGPVTYNWIGDDFINGKTTDIVTGTYSTSGLKFATTTISDGVSNTTVGCTVVDITDPVDILGNISGLSVTNHGGSCGGSVKVSWNAYTGTSTYNVSYKNINNISDMGGQATSGLSSIFDLSTSTNYLFGVYANDSSSGTTTTKTSTTTFITSNGCVSDDIVNGSYTCTAYQSGVPSPKVFLNKQMYWKVSGLPVGATYSSTKMNNTTLDSNYLVSGGIPTTVGTKTFSGQISGTTSSGTSFSGICQASTTVILGEGGFQEI
jgi:hypothetical protein